jgi:hypothetical protein
VARFEQEEAGADGRADDSWAVGSLQGAPQPFERSDLDDAEVVGGAVQEVLRQLAAIDAIDEPVRGQDLQPRRVHVDEGHHDAVGAGKLRVLVAERRAPSRSGDGRRR